MARSLPKKPNACQHHNFTHLKLFAAAALCSGCELDDLGNGFGMWISLLMHDTTSFPTYMFALLRPTHHLSVSRCSSCYVHTVQQLTQMLESSCLQLGSGRPPWVLLSAWRRVGVAVMQPPTASC